MSTAHDRVVSALGSLKLRITLGGIVALVFGIGLNTVYLTSSAERDTLTAYQTRELAESVRAARLIGERVDELQRSLKVFAGQLDAETVADPVALERVLDSKRILLGRFATLFVTAPDGRVLIYADEAGLHDAHFSVGDREYHRLTLAEHRPVISSPVPGRMSGESVIAFTEPLEQAGVVHGVLIGSARLSANGFLADLAEPQDADPGALVAVSDSHGTVLAHPSRQRLTQPLSEDPRLTDAYTEWTTAGNSTAPRAFRLPKTGQLASTAGVPGTDWMVWRVRSEDELLAPLRTARHAAGMWAAGLIALLSIGLFGTLWWLLKPLALLEKRAQHLFDGNLDVHEGWPAGSGEISRLGRVLRHVGAERAQLETFNAQVLRKLGSVMSAAPIGIAFTLNNRFELLSSEFCRLTGHREHQLMGQPMQLIFVSNEDHQALDPQVQQAFASGTSYVGEWQMLRADGTRFWGRLRGGPVDANEIALGAIWTLNDISEQVAKRQELQWSATHDPLTALANRKAFDQRAAALFEPPPAARAAAALVFVDLDHFKPINDTAGHAAGDAMLRAVAAAMVSQVRASDLVVRLGGDEFALLLERCSHEVAMRVAEKVRSAICAIALPWETQILRVGASLGVASQTSETADVDAWLKAADAACYAAKGAGRGTVRTAPEPALRLIVTRAAG